MKIFEIKKKIIIKKRNQKEVGKWGLEMSGKTAAIE